MNLKKVIAFVAQLGVTLGATMLHWYKEYYNDSRWDEMLKNGKMDGKML